MSDVGIEADEARETSAATVRLVDDFLVVDAFEELPRDGHAGLGTAAVELVQEAVRDELEPLLDQLVVDLALPPDLGRFLELGREPDFELAKPDVVKAGGIDVRAGDAAPEASAEFDGAIDGPVRLARVIDRGKYLSIHGAPLDGVLRPVHAVRASLARARSPDVRSQRRSATDKEFGDAGSRLSGRPEVRTPAYGPRSCG